MELRFAITQKTKIVIKKCLLISFSIETYRAAQTAIAAKTWKDSGQTDTFHEAFLIGSRAKTILVLFPACFTALQVVVFSGPSFSTAESSQITRKAFYRQHTIVFLEI